MALMRHTPRFCGLVIHTTSMPRSPASAKDPFLDDVVAGIAEIFNQSMSADALQCALLALHGKYLTDGLANIEKVAALNRIFECCVDWPGKRQGDARQQSAHAARKQSGSFYTPDGLAEFLAKTCVIDPTLERSPNGPDLDRWLALRIIDPAMGCGGILLHALNTMSEQLLKEADAIAHATGQSSLDVLQSAWLRHDPKTADNSGELAPPNPLQCSRIACDWVCCGVKICATWRKKRHTKQQFTSEGETCCFSPTSDTQYRRGGGGAGSPTKKTPPAGVGSAHEKKRKACALAAIARCCLYGIDTNALAIALSRQSFAAITGLSPDDFLQNFVCGDAIASPMMCHLRRARTHKGSSCKQSIPTLEDWQALGWNPLDGDNDAEDRFAPFFIESAFRSVFDRPNPGFDVVLMNPPWNKMVVSKRDFFAGFLGESASRERRRRVIAQMRQQAEVESAWQTYCAREQQWRRRVLDTGVRSLCGLDTRQRGHLDTYAMFLERACLLLRQMGIVGAVLPNAFYANHGASEVRKLILNQCRASYLFGFSNRERLFADVSAGLRFCLIKSEKSTPAEDMPFRMAFGLTTPQALTHILASDKIAIGSIAELVGTSGGIIAELSSSEEVAHMCALRKCQTFGDIMDRTGIHLGQEINVTNLGPYFIDSTEHCCGCDARSEPLRSELLARGMAVIHEKGTFCAYDTTLRDNVRYLFDIHRYLDAGERRQRLEASPHFRLACRSTIHAAEWKKSAFALIPPHCVVANSALVETSPHLRNLDDALVLMAVANTEAINEVARRLVGTNMKLFLIRQLPFPFLSDNEQQMLANSVLQLSVPASDYASLLETRQLLPCTEPSARNRLLDDIEFVVKRGLERKPLG